MNNLLDINSEQEAEKIINFLKSTSEKQKIDRVVIGLSGGIDSMTSFYLLRKVLPAENIIVAHLYYFDSLFPKFKSVIEEAKIPEENIYNLSIKKSVDEVITAVRDSGQARMTKKDELYKIRIGNMAARMRMIVLFDLAKKYKALVCGTENKTENLLGYFTRFGDQASDIEPISHLYKTQVLELARYLKIPNEFVEQSPTAGLWDGQTDEGEFGFAYEEADQVLYLNLEKNKSIDELESQGFSNAKKILDRYKSNRFKQQVPYHL